MKWPVGSALASLPDERYDHRPKEDDSANQQAGGYSNGPPLFDEFSRGHVEPVLFVVFGPQVQFALGRIELGFGPPSQVAHRARELLGCSDEITDTIGSQQVSVFVELKRELVKAIDVWPGTPTHQVLAIGADLHLGSIPINGPNGFIGLVERVQTRLFVLGPDLIVLDLMDHGGVAGQHHKDVSTVANLYDVIVDGHRLIRVRQGDRQEEDHQDGETKGGTFHALSP
jgi:hypothetical protein